MWICWVTERHLASYFDGQAGSKTTQRIAAHLHLCPRCHRLIEERRQLDALLHTLPFPVRAPDYWPQAVAALREKIRARSPSRWWALRPYFSTLLENPAQVMMLAAFASVAVVQTLVFLGVEDEAVVFVATHLLPLILI
jgi:anti-sigma factor RsiW